MCLALMIAIRITVTVFQAPAQLILTTAVKGGCCLVSHHFTDERLEA